MILRNKTYKPNVRHIRALSFCPITYRLSDKGNREKRHQIMKKNAQKKVCEIKRDFNINDFQKQQ